MKARRSKTNPCTVFRWILDSAAEVQSPKSIGLPGDCPSAHAGRTRTIRQPIATRRVCDDDEGGAFAISLDSGPGGLTSPESRRMGLRQADSTWSVGMIRVRCRAVDVQLTPTAGTNHNVLGNGTLGQRGVAFNFPHVPRPTCLTTQVNRL